MVGTAGGSAGGGRVVVAADDLIWADRLVRLVRAAGGEPIVVRSVGALREALPGSTRAVVDLTARAYDPLVVVAEARAGGCRVLAVAQHDDLDLHRRARSAGAERVVAYRLVHERGTELVRAWLADVAAPSPEAR